MRPRHNEGAMTQHAHECEGFEEVLHVAHAEWHGIRQATAACPGGKILISADEPITNEDVDFISQIISVNGYRKIVFQGYSYNADTLLVQLKARFLGGISTYVVTHVNSVQFESNFEMDMLAMIRKRLSLGTLDFYGSVKPGFSAVMSDCWVKTIVNFPPNLPAEIRTVQYTNGLAYIPLDVSWRKNLHTNIIAASVAENVTEVRTSNFPFGLESVLPLSKLRVIGFLRGQYLYSQMADANVVLCATLAECQPMTQLEALAVGTPCITGPLGLEELAENPLTQLCEISVLDNPRTLANKIEKVIRFRNENPRETLDLIESRLSGLIGLAESRYREFLNV